MSECSSEATVGNGMREIKLEIRTPLSAITGVALSLSDRLEGEDAAAAHLIALSCERLVHQVDRYFSDLAQREPHEGCERAIRAKSSS